MTARVGLREIYACRPGPVVSIVELMDRVFYILDRRGVQLDGPVSVTDAVDEMAVVVTDEAP